MSSVSRALRVAPARFQMPEALRAQVEAATRMSAPSGPDPRITVKFRPTALWFALAGMVIVCIAIAIPLNRRPAIGFEDELVADHIRSLQASHLFDVPSTDQHTVKPWFQGRIDFSPTVPDLTARGFPLLGGRLDYVANRPSAAIVYGRAKHIINVLVTKHLGVGAPSGVEDRNGFHIVEWTAGGLDYWAVSDVNPLDLVAFRKEFIAVSTSAPNGRE